MSSTTFQAGTVIGSTWLNDVNNTIYRVTTSIATQGQTAFTVPSYVLGGRLMVWVNGLLQTYNTDYTETNTLTITFSSGLSVGDTVTFRG